MYGRQSVIRTDGLRGTEKQWSSSQNGTRLGQNQPRPPGPILHMLRRPGSMECTVAGKKKKKKRQNLKL